MPNPDANQFHGDAPAKPMMPAAVAEFHDGLRQCFEPLCKEFAQRVHQRFSDNGGPAGENLNTKEHPLCVGIPHKLNGIQFLLTTQLCGTRAEDGAFRGGVFETLEGALAYTRLKLVPQGVARSDMTVREWKDSQPVRAQLGRQLDTLDIIEATCDDAMFEALLNMRIGEMEQFAVWITYVAAASENMVGPPGTSIMEKYFDFEFDGRDETFWGAVVSKDEGALGALRTGFNVHIGDYGEDAALHLYAVAAHMMTTVNGMIDICREADVEHRDTLLKTNFGAKAIDHETPLTLRMLQVAMVSFTQGLQYLTQQIPIGQAEFTVLTKRLCQTDYLQQLAGRMPVSFLGPSSLVGKFMGNLLLESDETPPLNEEVMAVIDGIQERVRAGELGVFGPLPAAGQGCAMAMGPATEHLARAHMTISDSLQDVQ